MNKFTEDFWNDLVDWLNQNGINPINLPILLLGFLTASTCSPSVQAQIGITAVPFLEINNDARSMGMAGANVAMRGARSGIHLNPAAFGKPNMLEFSSQITFDDDDYFFGTPWLPGFDNNGESLRIITPQFIAGFKKFSFGYQYTYLDLGTSFFTTSQSPGPIGSYHSYEQAHTISAAYHISRHISVGAGVNFITSNLMGSFDEDEYKAPERNTWDIGVYGDNLYEYEHVTVTPSFGWSITDIGNPIKYPSAMEADPLPIVMRFGLGVEVATQKNKYGLRAVRVAGYLSRDKLMARREDEGSPMGPIKAIFNSWDSYTVFTGIETVTLSLRDQLRKQYGLEITFFEFLSLRAGHFWEHEYNGDRKFSTLGFGVNYKYFTVDFAEIDADGQYHPLNGTEFLQFTANLPLESICKWVK